MSEWEILTTIRFQFPLRALLLHRPRTAPRTVTPTVTPLAAKTVTANGTAEARTDLAG
jgi:hypothetical protein